MVIRNVDVCCGLAWGDEAKGKIVAHLAKTKSYDFVCRWGGGNNAGHTVYINGEKYKTHLVPCGIFFGVQCIIGPDCIVHPKSFLEEIAYLKRKGFDTSLVKISPHAHIVTDEHIQLDKKYYSGTTARGIAPCYGDKYSRRGVKVKDSVLLSHYLWDELLYGNILCEGAQGFWLDINHGNYPYNTSSITLPYGACSLGFPPQYIKTVYGAAKIYDTRSGIDPEFPDHLYDNPELEAIGNIGQEYGTTTGRKRKVNWLNLDKLIRATNISGTTVLVLSKTDVLQNVGLFKLYYEGELQTFESLLHLKIYIQSILREKCKMLRHIVFSDNTETVEGI